MMGAMSSASKPPNFKQPQQQPQQQTGAFPSPMETRGARKEMRGPSLDPGLFNGTPLATNHPGAVNNYPKPPMPPPNGYYHQEPHDDDDRYSIASSDSSLSSLSSLSTVPKKINIQAKKNKSKIGGLELNIS
jgi:hypothetical protein